MSGLVKLVVRVYRWTSRQQTGSPQKGTLDAQDAATLDSLSALLLPSVTGSYALCCARQYLTAASRIGGTASIS